MGDVAKVSGIECVGIVKVDPDGRFAKGQMVAAIMAGARTLATTRDKKRLSSLEALGAEQALH